MYDGLSSLKIMAHMKKEATKGIKRQRIVEKRSKRQTTRKGIDVIWSIWIFQIDWVVCWEAHTGVICG